MTNLLNPVFRQTVIKGSSKTLYKTQERGVFTLSFDDEDNDIAVIKSKISQILFELLADCSISNHFIKSAGLREHSIHALEILPFVLKIYSFTNDDIARRLFCSSDMKLKQYLIELHLKNGEQGSIISREHTLSFGWLDEAEWKKIYIAANRAMDILYGFFKAVGIIITSIDFEFGKLYTAGKAIDIMIADELSPKNIHFRINDMIKLDFNESCIELAKRLGILKYE